MVKQATNNFDVGLATEMARNPATSPGNLEDLSAHPSRKVCKLVAQNPNTPEPVLKELWEFFPESILENPIIDVWDLTGAVALWQRLPDPVLWGMYHHFMRANQVERIQGIIPEQVRLRFPIINKTLGYWLSQDPSAKVRRQVAATAHRPEVQLKLALDGEISVRLALAENRQLSAYCHRVMASDPEEKVQTVLANNTYVKGDAEMFGFNILAYSDFEQVRVAAAANPLTPGEFIEMLCLHDDSHEVQVCAASNPNLSKLSHLVKQKTGDVEILAALARNPNADAGFLSRMAGSKNLGMRAAAASNPKTPAEDLVMLYSDREMVVRRACVSLMFCGKQFFDVAVAKGGHDLKCELARRAGRTREQLVSLATDPSRSVRQAVVNRLLDRYFQHDTETNRLLVEILSRDAVSGIRRSMVMDYRLRSTRLDQMAADPDPQVRRTVANHTRTGFGAMALLLNDSKRGVRFEAALTTLGTGWTWGQHNGILSLANGSRLRIKVSRVTDMLRCLVEDPCKKVRLLLAGHTCTPAGILGWLVDDRDEEVRETIRKRDTFPRDELIRLNGLHPNRYFSAGTITLTQRALKKLSDSSNTFTRGMVARNCRTSVAVLRKLSGDKSEFVRSKLSDNPKYMRMPSVERKGDHQ